MKKVIGYCRVSTTIQMEKDNSIKNQTKQIRDYCNSVCRQMNLNFSGQKIKECLANLV